MKRIHESVGFVGFGAMGQLMARKLFAGSDIIACDPVVRDTDIDGVQFGDMEDIARCGTVVLATPIHALQEVVTELDACLPEVADNPLVIEIGSVKQFPTDTFERFWPNYPELLLCHPLFGPQSARESVAGHQVLVTTAAGPKAKGVLESWQGAGLKIKHLTAEEHDTEMLGVQALPFLLGRLANVMSLENSPELETPSRRSVRSLEQMDSVHSDDLFRTMINGNPNTGIVLDQLMAALKDIKNSYETDPLRGEEQMNRKLLAAISKKIANIETTIKP